jgi:3-(3-hydroxy-phenyl)propionate hydroxylase
MLEELGLLEAGLEQGLVSPVFNYLDRVTGQLVGRFDIEAMRDRPKHPYVLQWEQYKIVGTVLQRLATDAGAEIRMSTRVVAIEQDANKVEVTVTLPDGSDEILSGRYLVGCDGGRSTIRKLADIEFDGFTWPERFLKIDTRFDFFGLRPELSNRNYFSDPDEWLNLFKARGASGEGMWRAVSPTLPEQTDDELLSPDAVEARLQKFCPKPGRYEIATIALYKVHQRVAATFNRGRVLLAGDSAHVNNPVGGMGMNGGIHDAMNLADKLARVIRGADPGLLDRYARQRRAVALDYVQQWTHRNREILRETDPVVREANLDELRRIASDAALARPYLRKTSMMASLDMARSIA